MTKNTTARKRSRIAGLSQTEIERVRALRRTDCPRCYCWWWRSSKFEFEISATEGCEVDELWFQKNPDEPSVCSRATGDLFDRDLHEPLEPHLINDGFSPLYFFTAKAGQTFVYLEVLDFEGDPTEITQVIGFEPTKTWKKGDPAAPNSSYVCRQSGWRFYSNLSLHEAVEAHLDNILSQLEMNSDKVKAVSKNFRLGIKILDKAHYMEQFSLSNQMLGRIYNLDLSLSFDHHHIPHDDDEEKDDLS
jgi:hypothetical protein